MTLNSRCVCGYAQKEYDMLEEYDHKRFRAAVTLFSVLVRFIVESKELFIEQEIAATARNVKIREALTFINSNFRKSPSADDVARKCNLSTSRFVHLFKEKCGIGYSKYLTERRIVEAKKLLTNTEMKICDIALYCGYASQSYFGMIFKDFTGISPVRYRIKFKRNIEP